MSSEKLIKSNPVVSSGFILKASLYNGPEGLYFIHPKISDHLLYHHLDFTIIYISLDSYRVITSEMSKTFSIEGMRIR